MKTDGRVVFNFGSDVNINWSQFWYQPTDVLRCILVNFYNSKFNLIKYLEHRTYNFRGRIRLILFCLFFFSCLYEKIQFLGRYFWRNRRTKTFIIIVVVELRTGWKEVTNEYLGASFFTFIFMFYVESVITVKDVVICAICWTSRFGYHR